MRYSAGPLREVALRPGRRYSEWRAAALTPLADLYGYGRGDPEWLGRLNAAIAARHEALGDDERERMGLQSWAFRANVVDPCIRLPEPNDGGAP